MGILKIDCSCNEEEMRGMVTMVEDQLYTSSLSDLSDIDQLYNDRRLCVFFEVFMHQVRIVRAEVLDEEWDELYEDTAVLNSRLRKIVELFNRNSRVMIEKEREIEQDQLV